MAGQCRKYFRNFIIFLSCFFLLLYFVQFHLFSPSFPSLPSLYSLSFLLFLIFLLFLLFILFLSFFFLLLYFVQFHLFLFSLNFLLSYPFTSTLFQARNQNFPKGGAKRGVAVWALEHRSWNVVNAAGGSRRDVPLYRKFLKFWDKIE